jgi:hypothetical protein
MEFQLLPIAMAVVFVAGGIAIQALERWADHVRDVLGTLFFMTALLVATALIVRNDPPSRRSGNARPSASAAIMDGGARSGFHTSSLRDTSTAVPAP